jgi:glucose-6-phosphate isomerase
MNTVSSHLKAILDAGRSEFAPVSLATRVERGGSIRAAELKRSAAGIALDFARELLEPEFLARLVAAFEADGHNTAMARLFSPAVTNPSEGRAALHWALRAPPEMVTRHLGPGHERLQTGLQAALALAEDVRNGTVHSASGEPYRAVVHLGIGGSDFGPRLIADAFDEDLDPSITLRFAANIDPVDIGRALRGLDPRTTLVAVVSKSWSTTETLTNALVARDWLEAGGVTSPSAQMVGISARPDRVRGALGPDARVLDMPLEVGGRFSLFSASSFACMVGLGRVVFEAFLSGAAEMDAHCLQAAPADNLAVSLALADLWRRQGQGLQTRAVLAYTRRLRMLPTYLQQLEMESNGKQIGPTGAPAVFAGAPVLWGGEGTIGQHSYHQLLHQGRDIIPAEFILARTEPGYRRALHANALAQAEVLLRGKSAATIAAELAAQGVPEADIPALAAQKEMPGNRPSTVITLDAADPRHLGALIALYEHRTYLSAVMAGLNAFDQWGVELGKVAATVIEAELGGGGDQPHDPATAASIADLRA